jgi:hypothetical protein
MEAIDRILRYLKKSPGKGILMKKINPNSSYTDADWVRSFDRKFKTNYYTYVYENIVK